MSDDELDVPSPSGRTITFRSVPAEILGRFAWSDGRLVMELAHPEGEGALPMLARSRALTKVEWRDQALTCANPNQRLRELLERRGFEVKDVPAAGEVYWKLDVVTRLER